MKNEIIGTEESESNGKTYVYKKTLGQKIGNGVFAVLGIGFGLYLAYQIMTVVINFLR